MSAFVNVGGSWKAAVPWVNIGGVWKQAVVWINVNGAWKQSGGSAAGGGSYELTPSYIHGAGRSSAIIAVTTNAATVNISDPNATFVWHASNPAWTAVSPGASSTSFRVSLGAGDDSESDLYCTVTTGGASHDTNTVSGYAVNTYALAGGP